MPTSASSRRRGSWGNQPRRVIFDGSKAVLKAHSQIDLVIVHHFKSACIEVIVNNISINAEACRIYMDYNVLSSQIDSVKFKKAFERKSEELRSQAREALPDDIANEVTIDLIVEFIVGHISVGSPPASEIVEEGQLVVMIIPPSVYTAGVEGIPVPASQVIREKQQSRNSVSSTKTTSGMEVSSSASNGEVVQSILDAILGYPPEEVTPIDITSYRRRKSLTSLSTDNATDEVFEAIRSRVNSISDRLSSDEIESSTSVSSLPSSTRVEGISIPAKTMSDSLAAINSDLPIAEAEKRSKEGEILTPYQQAKQHERKQDDNGSKALESSSKTTASVEVKAGAVSSVPLLPLSRAVTTSAEVRLGGAGGGGGTGSVGGVDASAQAKGKHHILSPVAKSSANSTPTVTSANSDSKSGSAVGSDPTAAFLNGKPPPGGKILPKLDPSHVRRRSGDKFQPGDDSGYSSTGSAGTGPGAGSKESSGGETSSARGGNHSGRQRRRSFTNNSNDRPLDAKEGGSMETSLGSSRKAPVPHFHHSIPPLTALPSSGGINNGNGIGSAGGAVSSSSGGGVVNKRSHSNINTGHSSGRRLSHAGAHSDSATAAAAASAGIGSSRRGSGVEMTENLSTNHSGRLTSIHPHPLAQMIKSPRENITLQPLSKSDNDHYQQRRTTTGAGFGSKAVAGGSSGGCGSGGGGGVGGSLVDPAAAIPVAVMPATVAGHHGKGHVDKKLYDGLTPPKTIESHNTAVEILSSAERGREAHQHTKKLLTPIQPPDCIPISAGHGGLGGAGAGQVGGADPKKPHTHGHSHGYSHGYKDGHGHGVPPGAELPALHQRSVTGTGVGSGSGAGVGGGPSKSLTVSPMVASSTQVSPTLSPLADSRGHSSSFASSSQSPSATPSPPRFSHAGSAVGESRTTTTTAAAAVTVTGGVVGVQRGGESKVLSLPTLS